MQFVQKKFYYSLYAGTCSRKEQTFTKMRVDTCIRSITLLATIRYKKKRKRKREKKKKKNKQTNKQTKEPFYLLTPDILAFRPLYKTTSKYVPSQDFAFPRPFQTLSILTREHLLHLLHFFLLASSSLEQDQPAQTDRIPKHLQWRDGRSESQHRT